jgi:hypothetical protein
VRRIRDGVDTSFWEDVWVDTLPLKIRFPRLFSISTQKEVSVVEVYPLDYAAGWRFSWRRRLFVWEEEVLDNLLVVINLIILREGEDSWGWSSEKGENFTVKSTFLLISKLSVLPVLVPQWHASAFTAIWRCMAPSKVNAFVWQLLHNRIPTRLCLVRWQIIAEDGDFSCALFW